MTRAQLEIAAGRAAAMIVRDLRGRRGLKQAWDAPEGEDQDKIRAEWEAIILGQFLPECAAHHDGIHRPQSETGGRCACGYRPSAGVTQK